MSMLGKKLEAACLRRADLRNVLRGRQGSWKLETITTNQELQILRSKRTRHPGIVMIMSCVFLAGVFAEVVCATDGDVVLKRVGSEQETPPAVFPHWSHRIRYRCYACHPGLFKMEAGGDAITMDEIMAGKSCGACHNGTIAWPVTFETCNRCHTPK